MSQEAAQEGADGEDNESLGGSSQLKAPSANTLANMVWGASPRTPAMSSFSAHLSRLSDGPSPAASSDAAALGANRAADGLSAGGDAMLQHNSQLLPLLPAAEDADPDAEASSYGRPCDGGVGGAQQAEWRSSADTGRQPPSVSDSVSTLTSSNGRKGRRGDEQQRKAQRGCSVM